MGGIFNMDGPFFKFGNAVADIMILSLIWMIFSIPFFTIGASTTALFYVTTRRTSDKEGYLFRDFLTSFKDNFKLSTKLWLLWVAMFALVISNIFMIRSFEFDPLMANILLPIQMIILIELFITSLYIFPITARFEMGFRQIIKSAFFMANRHMLTTVSCVATIIIIVVAAAWFFEPILIVASGLYAYVTSFMFMQIFRKYRPELDKEQLDMEPLPVLYFGDEPSDNQSTEESDLP